MVAEFFYCCRKLYILRLVELAVPFTYCVNIFLQLAQWILDGENKMRLWVCKVTWAAKINNVRKYSRKSKYSWLF